MWEINFYIHSGNSKSLDSHDKRSGMVDESKKDINSHVGEVDDEFESDIFLRKIQLIFINPESLISNVWRK